MKKILLSLLSLLPVLNLCAQEDLPPIPAWMGEAIQPTGEQHMAVAHGKITLPGIITTPAGWDTMKVKRIVVLVHGSGPCDMDETVGPNQPFRDIAKRLAARGVATLRYDKRTKVYGVKSEEVGGPLTIDTEVVDDALEAIRVAAKSGNRIYVLGHSQGGAFAPRIAERSMVQLAGLILMAAPARSFETILREQLEYISKQQPGVDADGAVKQVMNALPASYKLSMEQYAPCASATALGQFPILVAQGGHDYQVTGEDYKLWQRALKNNAAARFSFFPKLDHLMRPLPEKARPNDYMRLVPMSNDFMDAVEKFIKEN